MDKVNFPKRNQFDQIIRDRVQQYFKEHNINQTGNIGLYLKSIGCFIGALFSYLYLLLGDPGWGLGLFLVFMLVQFKVLLAFNVMHDGAHESFSTRKFWNSIASWSMDLLGSSSFLWKQKHNLLHHTYTNIAGKDDDIEIGSFLRLSPEQERKPWHKYQHIYAPFLYSLLSLYLLFYSDFQRLFSGKIGTTKFSHLYKKDVIFFTTAKVLYFLYTLVIPMIFYSPWIVLTYFIFGHLVFGLTLSVVFQLAHTVQETNFPNPDEKGNMPYSWLEHQLNTTCNFAPNNKFVTFYCGGLNYQVEHHMFHRISHIHYPKISKIVKQTCEEFGKPYFVNKGFFSALKSHFKFLRSLGQAA
jgi:linoleoyl-CoA desaturase